MEALTSRQEWTDVLRIDKSKLVTYLMCPRKFKLQYVTAETPEFTPLNLVFGKVIHEAVAFFYSHLKESGEKPALPDLIEEFTITWDSACLLEEPPIRFDEEHTADIMRDKGIAMLTKFYEEVQPRKVEAVEYPFCVDLVHPDTGELLEFKLVGIVDLIESDDEGNIIVTELKTASARMSDDKAENLLDGLVYAYAMDQLGYRTTDTETLVRVDVMVKTKKPGFQQVYVNKERSDYKKLTRWIVQILDAIEAGSFFAQPGWACKGCQFRKACEEGMAS